MDGRFWRLTRRLRLLKHSKQGALVWTICLGSNTHVLVQAPFVFSLQARNRRGSGELGSTVVQRQPGGAECVAPVHQQQRGCLFLPFVDDEPRTAEVISKGLLLARDAEIKDPTVRDQLLH